MTNFCPCWTWVIFVKTVAKCWYESSGFADRVSMSWMVVVFTLSLLSRLWSLSSSMTYESSTNCDNKSDMVGLKGKDDNGLLFYHSVEAIAVEFK